MKILSFDPGHKTGIVVATDGVVEYAAVVDCEWILEDRFLQMFVTLYTPEVVVLERTPIQDVDSVTAMVFNKLQTFYSAKQYAHQLHLTSPGLWKPVMKNQKPLNFGKHAADAAGLALFTERKHTA